MIFYGPEGEQPKLFILSDAPLSEKKADYIKVTRLNNGYAVNLSGTKYKWKVQRSYMPDDRFDNQVVDIKKVGWLPVTKMESIQNEIPVEK
jgi:hypothetical protein